MRGHYRSFPTPVPINCVPRPLGLPRNLNLGSSWKSRVRKSAGAFHSLLSTFKRLSPWG